MSVDAVEKALGEFELVDGAGSEEEKKACAMTLLAWVCGEPWSDHPPCANKTIANNVIAANDHPDTTPEMRRELVRAGRLGVLDTWWVPDEVVAWGLALTDGESADVYNRALRLLAAIADWKDTKERPNLREAVLREAVLRGAVLRGVDLSGADLSGASLREADLREAVLRRASLSEAVLRRADLRGADLSEAVLREAVLRGADLSGADLSEAVLREAVLRRADLRGASLREADLSGADLSGADLSGVVGAPFSGMPDGWKLKNNIWVKA